MKTAISVPDAVVEQVNAALDLEGEVDDDSEFLGRAARRAFDRTDRD